jgi:hypothetical protein
VGGLLLPGAPPSRAIATAFLSIGLGDHKGAALKFEQYAKKFPTQPDAEQVHFQAGAQWEQVSTKSAIDFYTGYLATYTGKSAQAANPDHVMEAYYKIAMLKEQSGVRGAALDAAWNDVSEAYAKLAPSGRVGPSGRNYAAHAAFRKVEQTFEAFKVIKFGTNDEKNAELLTKTKRDQLDAIVRDSSSIIETYQDFEYSSAALYIQGAAYFAYADMLFNTWTFVVFLLIVFLLLCLSAPWWGAAVYHWLWTKEPEPLHSQKFYPTFPTTPEEVARSRDQIRAINKAIDSQSDPLKGRLSRSLDAVKVHNSGFDFMKGKRTNEFPDLFSIAFTDAETRAKKIFDVDKWTKGSKSPVVYSFYTDLWELGSGNGGDPMDLLVFKTVDGKIVDWRLVALMNY